MSSSFAFSCLYSRHKTQKRKVWNDGKLTIASTGTVTLSAISNASTVIGSSAVTGNSVNAALDSVVISVNEVQCIKNGSIAELETEKFLVQIEGPYKEINIDNNRASNNDVNIGGTSALTSNASKALQKLMNCKFKIPQKVILPPQPLQQQPQQQLENQIYKGRKRPMQPGEWARQCQMRMNMNHNVQQHNQINNSLANNLNHQNQNHNQLNQMQQLVMHQFNHNDVHAFKSTRTPDSQKNLQNYQYDQPNNLNIPSINNQKQYPPLPLPPPTNNFTNNYQNPSLNDNHSNTLSSNNPVRNPQSTSNNNIPAQDKFLSNDFDPSSFYGNDDEESDGGNDAFNEDSDNENGRNNNFCRGMNATSHHRNNPYHGTRTSHVHGQCNAIHPSSKTCPDISNALSSMPVAKPNDRSFPMTTSNQDSNSPIMLTNNVEPLSSSDILKLFSVPTDHNHDSNCTSNTVNNTQPTPSSIGNFHPNSREENTDSKSIENEENTLNKQDAQNANTFLNNLLEADAQLDNTLSNVGKGLAQANYDGSYDDNIDEWDKPSTSSLWNDDDDDAGFDNIDSNMNNNDDYDNDHQVQTDLKAEKENENKCSNIDNQCSSNPFDEKMMLTNCNNHSTCTLNDKDDIGNQNGSTNLSQTTPLVFDINIPLDSESSSDDESD